MEYDFLIVGAGLTGCVFSERICSDLGKSALLIDIRDHVGGNVYDYYNEDGILMHKYGPHWFHTNDSKVFNYLARFTEWRPHIHKVMTSVDDKILPFPLNRTTINSLYGFKFTQDNEVHDFFESVKDRSITRPENAAELVASKVGWELYNKFYKNYTKKQWGVDPIELSPSVTGRIPVRLNLDDGYFTDQYQGMPLLGYTEMVNRMLNHKKITIMLNTDYKEISDEVAFKFLIYTGPIDYFFNYEFGELPYRSLRFHHETFNQEFYQVCQQVNYPNEFDYTRITEWKHATGQQHSKTTITKEFPCVPERTNEKFYPIPTFSNNEQYLKYAKKAEALDNVIFCGRLAEYKYYNMDQVVARALKMYETQIRSSF